MRSIVILYHGKELTVETAAAIMDAMTPILAEGHSQPEVISLSENEIGKVLTQHCYKSPVQSTEEGDNAVVYIMAYLKPLIECGASSEKIRTALTIRLAQADSCGTLVDHTFVNAMSYISQNAPVSDKIVKDCHFTKTIRNICTEVYKSYLNYKN